MSETNNSTTLLPLLPIGTAVHITSNDKVMRYGTRLVGALGGSLITALPTPRQLGKEVMIYDDLFFQGRELVMRLIHDGRVYAFHTRVLGTSYVGGKLLITETPASVQERQLRKEARFPCALPAEITMGGTAIACLMADISAGGGRVKVQNSETRDQLNEAKESEAELKLSVDFPDKEGSEDVPVVLKSIVTEGASLVLGVSFIGEQAPVKNYIDTLQLESVAEWFS